MKSSRRHELQKNVLNIELVKGARFLRARANYIFSGLLVVAVIVLVVLYVQSQRRGRIENAQIQYDLLMSDPGIKPPERLERLKGLAGGTGNPAIAALACVDVGDEYARRSIVAASADEAAELAARSAEYYRKAAGFENQPLAAAKAYVGLAGLAESGGDFDAAESHYTTALSISATQGQLVGLYARRGLRRLPELRNPAKMASTAPAEPDTQPAGGPLLR